MNETRILTDLEQATLQNLYNKTFDYTKSPIWRFAAFRISELLKAASLLEINVFKTKLYLELRSFSQTPLEQITPETIKMLKDHWAKCLGLQFEENTEIISKQTLIKLKPLPFWQRLLISTYSKLKDKE